MKAVLLLSGGLDSTLVAELMVNEGVELLAVNYKTPFCQCDKHIHGCAHTALTVASRLGIACRVINAGDDFLEILKNPKHGYGANMNPCQDCRILFFRKAKEIMAEIGASFIITGEVVGQRPMSQLKRQIALIEKEAGLEGLVLRPLSAKLLPLSIPEEKGWVNRDRLLAISGRSRKPQIALAKSDDHLFKTINIPGPVALGRGDFSTVQIGFSAGVVCRYADLGGRPAADLAHTKPGGATAVVKAAPLPEKELDPLRL